MITLIFKHWSALRRAFLVEFQKGGWNSEPEEGRFWGQNQLSLLSFEKFSAIFKIDENFRLWKFQRANLLYAGIFEHFAQN